MYSSVTNAKQLELTNNYHCQIVITVIFTYTFVYSGWKIGKSIIYAIPIPYHIRRANLKGQQSSNLHCGEIIHRITFHTKKQSNSLIYDFKVKIIRVNFWELLNWSGPAPFPLSFSCIKCKLDGIVLVDFSKSKYTNTVPETADILTNFAQKT